MESILSFKCVVGDTSCIYKDKKSLAQGKMTPKAKTVLSKKLVKAKMPKATIKPKAKIAYGVIMRFGKEDGKFHKHVISREKLDVGAQVFRHCCALYSLRRQL